MKRLTVNLLIPSMFVLFLYLISTISSATSHDFPKGQMIFEQRCAACHGFNAKGSYSMAKTLRVNPTILDLTRPLALHRTTSELEKTVSNGHYKMPKHKETLTPRQVPRSVVKYLRSLQTSVAFKTSSSSK